MVERARSSMVTNACRILRFPRLQQRLISRLEISQLLLERATHGLSARGQWSGVWELFS